MPPIDATSHYLRFAAAYIRGRAAQDAALDLRDQLMTPPPDALSEDALVEIYRAGCEHGLKLDRFKRSGVLPRVQKVLGMLQGIQPASVLDIGSGRGAFLWPLLDRFPGLPVTVIDASAQRAEQLQAVARGGLSQLSAHHMDATALQLADRQFDVVTALEVLEHIPRVEDAVREIVRVAQRFVILSVPSQADDNPEHIHLLTQPALRDLFGAAGVRQVKFDYVLNHLIGIANVSDGLA